MKNNIIEFESFVLVPNPCEKISCQPPGICLLSGNSTAVCACPDGKAIRSTGTNKTHETFTCKSVTADKCDLKCKQGHCMIENGMPKCICNPLYEGVLCEEYRCSGYCLNKGMCFQDLEIIKDGEKVPLKVRKVFLNSYQPTENLKGCYSMLLFYLCSATVHQILPATAVRSLSYLAPKTIAMTMESAMNPQILALVIQATKAVTVNPVKY